MLISTLISPFHPANAAELSTTDNDEIESDEIIIRYKKSPLPINTSPISSSSDTEEEEQFAEDFALSSELPNPNKDLKKRFRRIGRNKKKKISARSKFAVLKLNQNLNHKDTKKLIQKLNSKKFRNGKFEIEAVYPNHIYHTTEEYSGITSDPFNYQQLSFKQVKPDKLWQYTKGKGVVVAVIDTGVDYNHEDLKNNIWANEDEIANNGIDDDNNGYVDDIRGWDFVDKAGSSCNGYEDCDKEDNDPMDINSHGTHVSGIIAANQNNNIGISGFAPEAKIMALRAGYSTGASASLKTSDIIEAITYAIDNDADVINMSFAGSSLDVLDDILQLADNLGIVLVAAAGNSATSTPTYPAALKQVIAVGSIMSNDAKSSFSNYGDWVDIVAPGTWILSTVPGNRYDNKSGTSMAAPCVAAIAALLKAKNKLHGITTKEVKELLFDSAYTTTFNTYPGSATTINAVSADVHFDIAVDSIEIPTQAIIGETISIKGSGSDSNSEIVNYEWNSDIDGYLGSNQNLSIDNLSLGLHTISLRVQNASGVWSEPAYKTLNISETRSTGTFNVADSIKFTIAKNKSFLYAKLSAKNIQRIKAYKWISSNDGVISTTRKLSKANLNPGYQKISLLIQDKSGNWSKPIDRVVSI